VEWVVSRDPNRRADLPDTNGRCCDHLAVNDHGHGEGGQPVRLALVFETLSQPRWVGDRLAGWRPLAESRERLARRERDS
jgi:hypothetical protein